MKVVLHIDENEDLPWHRLTASLGRALPEPLLAQGYNLSSQVTPRPAPAQPSPAERFPCPQPWNRYDSRLGQAPLASM